MLGNHLWNSIRVKNYVKELGKRPTKWDENIAFLSECANITPATFLETDPISFGIMIWGDNNQYTSGPNPKMAKVMGYSNYSECMQYYYETLDRRERRKSIPIDHIVPVAEEICQPTEWRCSYCTALWRIVV